MRLLGIAVAAVASTFLLTSSAEAQTAPPWPNPNDIANALQQAAQAAQQAQQQASVCPTVEIGPGVRLPMCPNSLPKPPPGIVIPETIFPPITPQPFVDLRAQNLDGPVMHQQQTGVCYAFAITDVLDNSLRRQGRGDVLSPLHLVASGGFSTIFSPSKEALDAEPSWPYDPRKACKFEQGRDSCEQYYGLTTDSWRTDPQLVAERERARGIGVAGFRPATTITRDPMNGMVNALSMGRAVYLVLGIDSTAWGYSNVRSGMLGDYAVADRGDHAVAVVGYRWANGQRQFLLHNSWGTDWGERGFVWIAEPNLRRHFTSAYLLDAVPTNGMPQAPQLPQIPQFPLPTLPGWPQLQLPGA
jgi:hypothetical protein